MKQIQLTQGKVALVDDDLFEYLNQWKWYAQKRGKSYYYATRSENFKTPDGKYSCKTISMHRVITGAIDPKLHVDHINHCTLDNQRANLRVCTASENNKNVTSHKGSTSKYLGVCWYGRCKRWITNISVNGKLKHLGYFTDEIQAAEKYNEAALKFHGAFANLNVIPESNLLTAQNAAI